MPSIRITDNASLEILSTNAGPGSGISKYFKGDTAGFLASPELVMAANKPISTLTAGSLGFGLKFGTEGTFGTSGVDWKISANAPLSVAVTQGGGKIPGDELFLNPVVVPDSKSALSVSFSPTLSASIGATVGDLRFGFDAGGSVAFRAGRAFDLSPAGPTLIATLQDLFATGVVPGNIVDLKEMKDGDFASVSGSGHLKLSGSFNVASAINPLVSPTLGLKQIGSVQVDAGVSLEIGASVGIRGMYQIRVHKTSADQVRLAYYKMAGSQFQFEVTASADVGVTFKKIEILEKLMGMIGAPKEDVQAMVEAGLSDEQIADLKAAIEASLSRSIALSLAGSFAASKTETKIFEYVFDLNQLGNEGIDALQRALQADLTNLTSRSSDALPAGVRLIQSEFEEVRSRKTVWKINLLGIVNVLHVHELVRDGKTLFNADTGELVVTDRASAKNLFVVTRPLEADTQKLRKLLLQSFVATAAIRASGLDKMLTFSGTLSYFEQSAVSNRQTISDFLDNFVAALLITSEQKAEFLKETFRGPATVLLDLTLNDRDFRSLFFDGTDQPHSAEYYDTIARTCMGFLVQSGDENDFRRVYLEPTAEGEQLWKEMRSAGPAALNTVLPDRLKEGQRLAIIRHDYLVMSWWSDAMADAAGPVSEMRNFLRSTTLSPEALQADARFLEKREKLNKRLADIAGKTLPDFMDAWGLLAMYTAARRLAAVIGMLVTTGSVLVKSREGAAHA